MDSFLWGAAGALIVGLAWVAWKEPERIARLAMLVCGLAGIGLVGASIYDLGLRHAVDALHAQSLITDAAQAQKAIQARHLMSEKVLAGWAGLVAYLLVLMFLRRIVGRTEHPG